MESGILALPKHGFAIDCLSLNSTSILQVQLYRLGLCVNLTQAGVIAEKGASLEEMPP